MAFKLIRTIVSKMVLLLIVLCIFIYVVSMIVFGIYVHEAKQHMNISQNDFIEIINSRLSIHLESKDLTLLIKKYQNLNSFYCAAKIELNKDNFDALFYNINNSKNWIKSPINIKRVNELINTYAYLHELDGMLIASNCEGNFWYGAVDYNLESLKQLDVAVLDSGNHILYYFGLEP